MKEIQFLDVQGSTTDSVPESSEEPKSCRDEPDLAGQTDPKRKMESISSAPSTLRIAAQKSKVKETPSSEASTTKGSVNGTALKKRIRVDVWF